MSACESRFCPGLGDNLHYPQDPRLLLGITPVLSLGSLAFIALSVTPGLIKMYRLQPAHLNSTAKTALALVMTLGLACTLTSCNRIKHLPLPASESKLKTNVKDLLQTGESAFRRGDIELAHTCFGQALKDAERLGKDHPLAALALNDLALTAASDKTSGHDQKKNLAQAIAYQQRAVELEEKLYGKDSAYVAYDLNNLGSWYGANSQYKEAGQVLARSLTIGEKVLKPNDALLAFTMTNLGNNYLSQKRYVEAEDFV